MVAKNMTFVPGQEPGPFASGLVHKPDVGPLESYRNRMLSIPTGSNVAARIPWIRTILESSIALREQRTFSLANNPVAFKNLTNKPVKLHEIRFRMAVDGPRAGNFASDMWVQMSIPDRKAIISDWLPYSALQTEMDTFIYGLPAAFCWEWPAPYFLHRGHPFVMDLEYNETFFTALAALDGDYGAMMGLHGQGTDGEPIDFMLPIEKWESDGPTGNNYVSYTFNDDQDHPMRDAWITHFTLGAVELPADTDVSLRSLRIRPQAPEGPKWHIDEFFRIDQLASQVDNNDDAAGYLGARVIHRPRVPYTLYPGEALEIILANYFEASASMEVTLHGTQEI